jgi:acetylornithine/succinyldiaminopimelate/putrescine aminotransferase
LVSQLLKVLPEKLNNIYLVNSGTEATEAAMKLAKRYTGRKKIIATTKSYHGSTQGALSLMSDTYFTEAFQPLLPHIEFINFNNIEDLNKIDKDTAAVITETVKAEVGVEKPKNNYLKKLKEKCIQENVLLILDEIQVGCGRTGTFFAFEQYDIEPDILLLAKGLGAGMPIGAFISNTEIMKTLSYNPVLGHITTFGGHPVSAAAAAENIKILQRDYAQLIQSVKEKENRFLSKLKHPKIKQIRSAGLLIAVELDSFETVKKTMNQCLEYGLITDWFLFNDSALRIAPPLIITMEEIDQAVEILLKSLDDV